MTAPASSSEMRIDFATQNSSGPLTDVQRQSLSDNSRESIRQAILAGQASLNRQPLPRSSTPELDLDAYAKTADLTRENVIEAIDKANASMWTRQLEAAKSLRSKIQ